MTDEVVVLVVQDSVPPVLVVEQQAAPVLISAQQPANVLVYHEGIQGPAGEDGSIIAKQPTPPLNPSIGDLWIQT